MAEAAPSTPAPTALLRLVPLSLWPEHVLARRRRLRRALRRLEPLLDRTLAELDALTPDPDLEPSLAASECFAHSTRHLPADIAREVNLWARGGSDDREADYLGPCGAVDADLEPTLGAPDGGVWRGGGSDQRQWAKPGDRQDGEGEPDDDGEPWLGSLTTPCTMTVNREPGGRRAIGLTVHRDDQRGWAMSGVTDAEEQSEDEGEPEGT